MELLSQIIELVKEFWERIAPYAIVNEYDEAIVLRLGKYKKTLKAGFHWKIPLVDSVNEERISVTTLNVKPQTLTTLDEKTIVVSAVVKYSISDVKTFLINVENAADALNDITQGKIKGIVMSKTWDELKKLRDHELKDKLKNEASDWGIKISFVTITDLAQIRTIRLIQ